MSKTKYGEIEQSADQTSVLLQQILIALRALIYELDANTCEIIRPVERFAT